MKRNNQCGHWGIEVHNKLLVSDQLVTVSIQSVSSGLCCRKDDGKHKGGENA
ncbi:hypothetical protein SpAn4DRAFT_2586 [Sporomusa ovata]|uniref:Uncharacterized protein n=1 Tax=Sporomusa ovata TaxID=2378 RepID=A0A0U1L362_9FIRM|nr:hypothetical protein SpAn4DRAFT_2586 [Sporomusa ovata]